MGFAFDERKKKRFLSTYYFSLDKRDELLFSRSVNLCHFVSVYDY